MPAIKVGKKAIKISCLQVVPGKEFEVANKFKVLSKENKERIAIFKGFGVWDLILMYESDDFDPSLSLSGPLPYIVNTTTFFCFTYVKNNVDVLNKIAKSKFAGLVFLKLNISEKMLSADLDYNIGKLAETYLGKTYHVLGSIGWNEYILIALNEDITNIANSLFELNTFEPTDNLNVKLMKTFTSLSLNHKYLPTNDNVYANENKIKNKLDDLGLNIKINKNIKPTIYMAAMPTTYRELMNYWFKRDNKYNVNVCFGEYDISVCPKREINWSDMLSALLNFREVYGDKIASTCTTFRLAVSSKKQKTKNVIRPNDARKTKKTQLPYKGSFERIEKLFGSTMANYMINQFYYLNSLHQHPFIAEAMDRLVSYPEDLLKDIEQITKDEIPVNAQHYGLVGTRVLADAMELRLYGTPGNIIKNYSKYGRFGGGVHRAIMAMEGIPSHIFSRFNEQWQGFIIVEDPKFSHFRDVIMVPTESVWKPANWWWAIYHEVAHVMIDRSKWLNRNAEQVKHFLEKVIKEYRELWMDQLEEIMAEIIGFKLGFYDDFKLFLDLIWSHLVNIEKKQHPVPDFSIYTMRTFATKLYCEIEKKNMKAIIEEYDEDKMYKLYLSHLKIVKDKIVRERIKNGSDPNAAKANVFRHPLETIAAKDSMVMIKLIPFLKYIQECLETLERKTKTKICPESDGLNHNNTNEIYNAIKIGKPTLLAMEHPEAILYKMMVNRKSLGFKSQMAAVLAYWRNCLVFKEI